MNVNAVVLDAANIACKNRRGGAPPEWRFARVERVKRACLDTWPGALVRAVIDASAEQRLADRGRSDTAHKEGWLQTAPGDADDLALDIAAHLGAAVVSRDNFMDARRDHPWLEREAERVWSFSIQKDRSVVLRPRRLLPATDEQVAEARRKKARKAGIVTMGEDEVWTCTGPPDKCNYAGQAVPVLRRGGDRLCKFCSYPAVEQVYTPVPKAVAPLLTLLVNGREHGRFPLPPDGLVLGRGGPSRPDVTDLTAGLDGRSAHAISRRHLQIEPDDEGWPVVVHRGSGGDTFLNPRVGADGLPLDNRLAHGERYPLIEGDELWLGEGRVRLIVSNRDDDE